MVEAKAFQIWVENRVVLACIRGCWDRFSAEDYSRAFKAAASRLTGQPWAHIVYLDDWQLGTPDIEPIVQELVGWCLQNGLIVTAQVYCPHSVKRYQLDKMIIEKTPTFERRGYANEDDAFNWLEQQGFSVHHASLQRCV
ncbi:hypothetical protein AAY72_05005 [Alishewanella sp. WH16-1]|uniref:hypothetical protein n=1 Tax=Alishewanella sp. WH16-1 TaxID=1651088 RepID=UPI000708E269|nr:hypothetical protein [Alishewanella sp. WH16-1]KRS22088.1 hypothetical protein AAY72_05005 [Alishewanella sp. WH16-1]